MARFPIHPPYLVNRLRGDTPEELLKSTGGAFSELHRYIRYLLDANDFVQKELGEITGDGPESVPTEVEMHAKIMIRVSLDF